MTIVEFCFHRVEEECTLLWSSLCCCCCSWKGYVHWYLSIQEEANHQHSDCKLRMTRFFERQINFIVLIKVFLKTAPRHVIDNHLEKRSLLLFNRIGSIEIVM